MMEDVKVMGAITYQTSDECNKIIAELKGEFGENVRISVRNRLITYKCLVTRNMVFF